MEGAWEWYSNNKMEICLQEGDLTQEKKKVPALNFGDSMMSMWLMVNALETMWLLTNKLKGGLSLLTYQALYCKNFLITKKKIQK